MTRRTIPGHRVPVIRFRAGELHLAVAADSIDTISTSPPRSAPAGEPVPVRHVASLMGEAPQPPAATQRHIRVRHGDAALDLVIDGPVAMASVTVRDIAPIKSAIARAGLVLGFARLGGEVIALLDVSKLFEAAQRDTAPALAAHGADVPARPDPGNSPEAT